MKNGLVLALAILGGLYFLSYFGLRSWPLCPGWGWRSSYLNNLGIWPGHPFYWLVILVVLGCAVLMFFSRSKGRSGLAEKNEKKFCPHCRSSLKPQGAGSPVASD